MSHLAKFKRFRALGVTTRLRLVYWRMKSRFYFAPQFESFGRRSVIEKPLLIENVAGITIGDDCSIRPGARLEVVDRPRHTLGRIRLGDRVSIEQNVHISACDLVEIEDDVCVSAGVVIVDTSHPTGVPGDGSRVRHISEAPSFVKIGRRVFIGANSVILPNVSIGENSVIGAGSVVARDIPANCVAAGSPARVVKVIPT